MIYSLSWKNIWRSKRRSFTIIGAIVIGVWALVFMIGFYNSFVLAFSRNAINYEHSHLQIHDSKYIVEPDIKHSIESSDRLLATLDTLVDIANYSGRIKVNGMIGSAKTSSGIQVYGIDPAKESQTTNLEKLLQSGTYFQKIKRNPILLSQKMADKLKVKIRSKVVITFQDIDLNITSASFRVEGIFDSKSPKINGGVVYVRQSDLIKLTGDSGVHEIGILVSSINKIEEAKNRIKNITTGTVRTYKEIAPEFNLMEESSRMTKVMLTGIIMFALLLGILNMMLMAVLERTKEIGMLRSVGMHRGAIFSMIIIETSLLGILAGPLGSLLGYFTISRLRINGLDLSSYADALKQYGYDVIFYPELNNSMYLLLMVAVILTTLLGAIVPAIIAIKIDPLKAIRKI